MKKFARRILATTAGIAMAAGLGTAAMAAEPIKIGSVLSATGPAAFLGDPEAKTLQLYVEKINKEGGVLGRPLQLVHYDDGSETTRSTSSSGGPPPAPPCRWCPWSRRPRFPSFRLRAPS
jgi:ABC-type glycerol-3-phosphate transport system substrate-binding protein